MAPTRNILSFLECNELMDDLFTFQRSPRHRPSSRIKALHPKMDNVLCAPGLPSASSLALATAGSSQGRKAQSALANRGPGVLGPTIAPRTLDVTACKAMKASYESLQGLKSLFVSEEWNGNKLSPIGPGKAVAEIELSLSFWQSVENCMRASQPLLIALRIADGDERLAMLISSVGLQLHFAIHHINANFSCKKVYSGPFAESQRDWDPLPCKSMIEIHGRAISAFKCIFPMKHWNV